MFSHFFLKGNTSLCFSMVTALQTAFLSDEGKKVKLCFLSIQGGKTE